MESIYLIRHANDCLEEGERGDSIMAKKFETRTFERLKTIANYISENESGKTVGVFSSVLNRAYYPAERLMSSIRKTGKVDLPNLALNFSPYKGFNSTDKPFPYFGLATNFPYKDSEFGISCLIKDFPEFKDFIDTTQEEFKNKTIDAKEAHHKIATNCNPFYNPYGNKDTIFQLLDNVKDKLDAVVLVTHSELMGIPQAILKRYGDVHRDGYRPLKENLEGTRIDLTNKTLEGISTEFVCRMK